MINPRPSFFNGYATHGESIFPDLWEGVVAAWAPFLGVQGGKLFDFSGFLNHGTLDDRDMWGVWGVWPNGNVLTYNGSSDNVVIGDIGRLDFDGTTPFSIFAIVRRGGLGAERAIISKNAGVLGWTLWFRAGNQLGFFARVSIPSNRLQVITTQTFTDPKEIIYLLVTYDGSQTVAGVKMYIKGVSVALTLQADSLSSSIANSGNVTIGSRSAGTDSFFNGSMDTIIVYDRVISKPGAFKLYKKAEAMWNFSLINTASIPLIPPSGRISRYHNLNGLGGQGQMTWNPLG